MNNKIQALFCNNQFKELLNYLYPKIVQSFYTAVEDQK